MRLYKKQIDRLDVQKKYGKKYKVASQCGFSVKIFMEDIDKIQKNLFFMQKVKKKKQILLQMNEKSLMKFMMTAPYLTVLIGLLSKKKN